MATLLYSTPPVPAFLKPLFLALYYLHFGVMYSWRRAVNFLYRSPIFQGRCASVGKNFNLWWLPEIRGPVEIHIGDHVNIFGSILVESSLLCGERPKLMIGSRVDLGHNLVFVINKEVVIGDDVRIASGVRFLDTDDFPLDPAARQNYLGPTPEEVKPVRIGNKAWIGQNAYILKGVTVGEGAIIGVGSVVSTDIPAFSVAVGNPARVLVKNINTQRKSLAPDTPPES